MAQILIDTRNLPANINLEEFISGVHVLEANPLIISDVYQGRDADMITDDLLDQADVFVVLNPKIDHSELKLVVQKGLVPLIHKDYGTLGFEAFHPVEEIGNSFLFNDWNSWEVFAALVRCMENYQFPYDWKNIVHSVKNIEIELD